MIEPADPRQTPPRRGALWPWLVTPLVTLALFYALNGLHNQRTEPPAPAATRQP